MSDEKQVAEDQADAAPTTDDPAEETENEEASEDDAE